jgi:hypothetical protein
MRDPQVREDRSLGEATPTESGDIYSGLYLVSWMSRLNLVSAEATTLKARKRLAFSL